jgi:alcohol dehydrogenase class IV
MTTYQLAQVPQMTIGAGARWQIGDLAKALVAEGAPILLVADPGLATTGRIGEIAGLLTAAGFPVEIFSDIKSDPSIAQAEAAVSLARGSHARLMVALGGGSALDLGKAVAAIAGAEAPAETYALSAAPLPANRLKTICMPTTSGTGSETTRTAILSAPDGAKLWFWGDELKTDHALLDPELTVSLPAHLTAATGIDALVHAVEAATNRNANAGNDLYAHAAIRLVARHLETAVTNPADLVAREGLQRAAALAGTAIDNGGTAIAHAIGHAMASLRPTHHGRAVGIAMLGSLPWVVADDPDGRFAACAAAMGAEPTARGFIEAYGELLRRTGLRIAMHEDFAGITPDVLATQMTRPENVAMIRSTRREASRADLVAISEAVLSLH